MKALHTLARLLVAVCIGQLAGCATTAPTTIVQVPVPVECQEAMPDRPAMPTEQFTAKPALDAYVRAAQAEIKRREGYEGQLRTALAACKAPISLPPKGSP